MAASPCGTGGVSLALSDDRTGASMDVPDGALGPTDQPLVLEVTGRIEDDAGRRKQVSRSFDFQIVREAWNPQGDAFQEDAPADSGPPLPDATIAQGPHFFFAQFKTPISLPQQFWVDVRIDGKHSFEDTIEQVTDAKLTYGRRTALLGGIDLDFLCRATTEQVRERVRRTLDVCQTGGGYCLGSGNSVANYVPVENYLAMVDEGRRWRP